MCKTCFLQFNERIFQCHDCLIFSGTLHPWDHEFWRWSLDVTKRGMTQGIHCKDCGHGKQFLRSKWLLSVNNHAILCSIPLGGRPHNTSAFSISRVLRLERA